MIEEYDSNYSAASLDEAYLDITDYLLVRLELGVEKRTFPKNFVAIFLY